MKKIWIAVERFVYGTWYGAMVVFVAVTVLLHGLQLANSGFGDIISWPKGIHIILMLIALVNLGGAMLFSLSRRSFRRGFVLFLLCGVAFFGFVTMSFIVYCVPTRTSSAPDEEWVESTICATTAIPRDKLTFLGGISAREGINVFAVADAELGKFRPGSPWGAGNDSEAINHYRSIMKYAHIDVTLPDDARILRCDGSLEYIITIVEANGNRYLFCKRL